MDEPQMSQFAWVSDAFDGALIVNAPNREIAYRIVIGHRVSNGQTPEEAVGWFREHDRLERVAGVTVAQPYEGDLPDEDE